MGNENDLLHSLITEDLTLVLIVLPKLTKSLKESNLTMLGRGSYFFPDGCDGHHDGHKEDFDLDAVISNDKVFNRINNELKDSKKMKIG